MSRPQTLDSERVKELWPSSSITGIADALGTTRSAIGGLVNRLLLRGEIERKSKGRIPGKPRAVVVRVKKTENAHATPMKGKPSSPEAPVEPIPLLQSNDGSCRFPMWADSVPCPAVPLICGRSRRFGPYCLEHAARCFPPGVLQKMGLV